jgi:hypothetical protein
MIKFYCKELKESVILSLLGYLRSYQLTLNNVTDLVKLHGKQQATIRDRLKTGIAASIDSHHRLQHRYRIREDNRAFCARTAPETMLRVLTHSEANPAEPGHRRRKRSLG